MEEDNPKDSCPILEKGKGKWLTSDYLQYD